MITQTYIVNMRVGAGIAPKVKISQGDIGRNLAFKLFDGVSAFTPPAGSTAEITGRKPSGLGFSENCTMSGNIVTVSTTLDISQESGNVLAELKITNGSAVVGTANFVIYVEPAAHPDGTTDGTTEEARTVLEQCEAYAQAAQDAAEAASGDYTQLSAEIGTLSELTTTAKSSVVAAINEVNSDLSDVKVDLGDLSELETETKTDLVSAINEVAQSDGGLSEDVKAALLQLAQKVAYIDDGGQDYYDDLYDALYPPTNLISISAVYTQGDTVYTSATLNSLKTNLVVTAHYDDNSSETITDYSLSGTLTAGTSTITVSYGGKTTTFDVTVTAVALSSISAAYTQTGVIYTTDDIDNLKTNLVVTATYNDSSSETVASSDCTLSGTLASGTSTVTVTYEGKTDTFSVAVTAWDVEWDYTDGTPIGNGWVNTTSVTGTMQDTGYQMGPVNSGTSGCTLAHSPDVEYSHGVVEIDFTIVQMAITTGQYQGYCIFAPGVRFRIYDNKFYVEMSTTNTYADRIQIGTMSEGERYILRFEYNKTAGGVVVWVNGEKIYETSVALNANTTRLLMNATMKDITGNKYQNPAPATLLHAIRCKEVA